MGNEDLKYERLFVTKDGVVIIDTSMSAEDMIFQLNSNFLNYEWMNYTIKEFSIWECHINSSVWVRDPSKLHIHHLNQ